MQDQRHRIAAVIKSLHEMCLIVRLLTRGMVVISSANLKIRHMHVIVAIITNA